MCHITIPKPIVRSMRPAIIGTIAASESSAMIALSLRIERALIAVGNDSGSSSEKKHDQQDGQDRQAVDRQDADDRPAAAERRQLRARRLERVRFQGLHRCPLHLSERCADAAASRFSAHRSSPDSSATTLSAIEHQRAVADFRNLFEVGRDDQNRRAPLSTTSNSR